jgi:HSP20 family protein
MKYVNVHQDYNPQTQAISYLFIPKSALETGKRDIGEFDEIIDDFFNTLIPGKNRSLALIRPQKVFSPPTDVYETESELVIKLEIAGINPDAVAVSVYKDGITIRGIRRGIHTHHLRKCSYHLAEINYGVFERHLPLFVPVNERLAKATYQQGFLIITLPRLNKKKTKTIKIETEE